MLKETIISIVIIVAISLGNIVTQNYTKESVGKINEKLEGMKLDIENVVNAVNDVSENDKSQESTNSNQSEIPANEKENTEEMKKTSEKIKNQINEIKEEWEKRHDKLACYIEHDELEKVEDKLVSLESDVNMEDYEQAMNNLKESTFFLQHIQDKYAFNLINIF